MTEEIMIANYVDIIDTDHGTACIEVSLYTPGSGQSFMLSVSEQTAYKLLVLFQANSFRTIINKPVVVIRDSPFGLIRSIKRLPCYDPYEVTNE